MKFLTSKKTGAVDDQSSTRPFLNKQYWAALLFASLMVTLTFGMSGCVSPGDHRYARSYAGGGGGYPGGYYGSGYGGYGLGYGGYGYGGHGYGSGILIGGTPHGFGYGGQHITGQSFGGGHGGFIGGGHVGGGHVGGGRGH